MQYVELSVPAAPTYLSLIRLSVGSVATRLDATLDELEDLQLAVDELCLLLLSSSTSEEGRLQVHIEWEGDLVEVRCGLPGAVRSLANGQSASGLGPEALSRQILDALVDEHGADVVDGVLTAWLKKRRVPAITGP